MRTNPPLQFATRRERARPRRLGAAAVSLALAVPAAAQPAAPATVPTASACAELRVEGVTPGAGQLQIAVYGSRETYRKRSLLERSAVPQATTYTLPLCGLAATEIAVVVTQDLDDDGTFDTNLVGMPKEPWGASGRRTLGPPSWDSARVALAPGGTIVVALR